LLSKGSGQSKMSRAGKLFGKDDWMITTNVQKKQKGKIEIQLQKVL
jgi:hypothetical protein